MALTRQSLQETSEVVTVFQIPAVLLYWVYAKLCNLSQSFERASIQLISLRPVTQITYIKSHRQQVLTNFSPFFLLLLNILYQADLITNLQSLLEYSQGIPCLRCSNYNFLFSTGPKSVTQNIALVIVFWTFDKAYCVPSNLFQVKKDHQFNSVVPGTACFSLALSCKYFYLDPF